MPAAPDTEPLNGLLAGIRACRVCMTDLPLGPRPVLVAHPGACLLIAGQAPGTKVPASGNPWFEAEAVPVLQAAVRELMQGG